MTENPHHLLPPCALKKNGPAATELMRAVMVRSNFIPNVRHSLGWRGVQEIVNGRAKNLSFTSKIQNMPGVYGLRLIYSTSARADFELCYFPSPEDPLIENFCVQAGITALANGFAGRVREFSTHPDLYSLFKIARIRIHFDVEKGEQYLSLKAPDKDIILAGDGVWVKTAKGLIQAVKPGETDQEIRGFDTAMHFFRVLVSSFCYTQGAEVDFLQQREMPGYRRIYRERGEIKKEESPHCRLKELLLGINSRELPPEMVTNCGSTQTLWEQSQEIPEEFSAEPWWGISTPTNINSITRQKPGGDNPKLIVLTGFLGSGKTSFLDKFIAKQTESYSFVAVIQNEIGEKGLDGKLLDQSYAVTEIDEGCICCTLAGNLRAAAEEIMRRHAPDFIILETTGLANPANILQEIYELEDILVFGSITCIVDAVGGEKTLNNFEIARSQVRLADEVLVNKSDLVEEKTLCELENKIHDLNPLAATYRTMHGDIHPGLLYGVNMQQKAYRAKNIDKHKNRYENHMHDHVHNRLLRPAGPLKTEQLISRIDKLQKHILRIKGVIELEEEAGPVVFQYSPGTYCIETAPEKLKEERYLVVIGQNLAQTEIESLVCPE
ncbi:MAG: CobW family GTP-binding protein [Desulfonatronovibrionaceae bacterium]